MVAGHNKALVVNKVGRVAVQEAALMECFQNQRNVALFQIPHSAMNELRAPARCAFGEILLFDQSDSIPTRCRVHRGAKAAGSPTHDQKIKDGGVRGELINGKVAMHSVNGG